MNPSPLAILAGIRLNLVSGAAMDWKTMLAYVTGTVDEELLRRNEYLVAALSG